MTDPKGPYRTIDDGSSDDGGVVTGHNFRAPVATQLCRAQVTPTGSDRPYACCKVAGHAEPYHSAGVDFTDGGSGVLEWGDHAR